MDYTYIDNYNTTASGYMLSSAIITISLVIFLVGFFLVVLNYIGMWKVFVKAGIPGWKCLIPFYNTYLTFRLAMGNGWLFLLCLVPVANIIILIMCMISLAKAFRAGTGFGIGLIFLNSIFMLILAFGHYQYYGVEQPGQA